MTTLPSAGDAGSIITGSNHRPVRRTLSSADGAGSSITGPNHRPAPARRGLRRNKSSGEAEPTTARNGDSRGKIPSNGSTHSSSNVKVDLRASDSGQTYEEQEQQYRPAVTPGIVSVQGRGLRKNPVPEDQLRNSSHQTALPGSSSHNNSNHQILDSANSVHGQQEQQYRSSESPGVVSVQGRGLRKNDVPEDQLRNSSHQKSLANGQQEQQSISSVTPGVVSVQGRGLRKNPAPEDQLRNSSHQTALPGSSSHNNSNHQILDSANSAHGQQEKNRSPLSPGVVSVQGRGLRKNPVPEDQLRSSSHHTPLHGSSSQNLSVSNHSGTDLTPAQITGATARRGLSRNKSGGDGGGQPPITKVPSGAGLRAMRNHARDLTVGADTDTTTRPSTSDNFDDLQRMSYASAATAEGQEDLMMELMHQGNITVLPDIADRVNLPPEELVASIQAEAHIYDEKRQSGGKEPNPNHSDPENNTPERELSSEPSGTVRYNERGVARKDSPLPEGSDRPRAYNRGPGFEYDPLSSLHGIVALLLGTGGENSNGEAPSAEDIKRSKKRCYTISGVFLVVIIIIVVVVVVVVGGGGSEADALQPNNEGEGEGFGEGSGEQEETDLVGFNLDLLPDLPDTTLEKLDDPESPQSQAFIWLSEDPNWQDYPDWRKLQRFGLASFYYAMGGTKWPASNEQAINWLDYDMDECQWMAYEPNACHEDGGVKTLNFTRLSGFRGFVPPEIQFLEQLQQIDFSNNILNEPFDVLLPLKEEAIPSAMTSIQCAQCRLQGSLPSEIGMLTGLEALVLTGNSLTGSLPTELGLLSLLTVGYMEQNELSGTLPSEIGLLASLTKLGLTENALSAFIPSEIGNLFQLQWLGINFNSLSETLPTTVGRMTQLVRIDLEANTLSGPLPTELGLLSRLTTLDLLQNGFTGSVPTEVSGLTALMWFGLATNSLSGSIPTECGKMTSVTHFDIPYNRLVGTIPSELGLLTQMTYLNLVENSISGTVPPEVEALPKLTTLSV